MKQKQHCNKFNKGSKNDPHQKNLIKEHLSKWGDTPYSWVEKF